LLLASRPIAVITSATVTLTDSVINWKEFVNIVFTIFANLMSCQCRYGSYTVAKCYCDNRGV